MRPFVFTVSLALVLAVTGPVPLKATETDWTPIESEIWALERAYLNCLQTEDVAGHAEFWHEEFIGWPSHAVDPVDRSTAAASLSTLFESVQILSAQVHPLMIRVMGDLAVVQYRLDLEIEDTDGLGSTASYRMTHTWLREGGSWRIIGGMSSSVASR